MGLVQRIIWMEIIIKENGYLESNRVKDSIIILNLGQFIMENGNRIWKMEVGTKLKQMVLGFKESLKMELSMEKEFIMINN